ncbi:MAG: 16S rRNA (cytosine(967)-C(5))-methyltransferase RsmB [Thermodesulfobacteriota bacterium]
MKSKGTSSRLLAHRALNSIVINGEHPDTALQTAYQNIPKDSPKDRVLITEFVLGVIRWLAKLDYIIDRFVKKKTKKQEVQNLLRLGTYQLILLSGIKDHAAINETVEVGNKVYGNEIARFINATLREMLRSKNRIRYPELTDDPLNHIAIERSFPPWLVDKWIQSYGVDYTLDLTGALNKIPPLTMRVNTQKTSRDELIESLKAEKIESEPTKYSPVGIRLLTRHDPSRIPDFKKGLFTVQDEAAQLCTYILGPEPGERVWDVCSAPGGKTTHIAQLMNNTGEVIATDSSAKRLSMVEEHAGRLSQNIIKTVKLDAAEHTSTDVLNGEFDKVLVDAPCTGLGTIRRNPDAKWKKTPEDPSKMSALQYRILENASKSLRSGGVIVYAVCTLTREENENVCFEFLQNHDEFELDPSYTSSSAFLDEFIDEGGFFIFDPVRHNTDGFFVAKFIRTR